MPWVRMYADGVQNAIFESDVPDCLIGLQFNYVSWFLFETFGVLTMALLINDAMDRTFVVLNPGDYSLRGNEQLIYLAKDSISDRLKTFTGIGGFEQFLVRKNIDVWKPYDSRESLLRQTSRRSSANEVVALPSQKMHVNAGECHTLIESVTLADCVIKSAKHMVGHLVVIGESYDVIEFVAQMRSIRMKREELKPIVFLKDPSVGIHHSILEFPDIYVLEGSHRSEKDLLLCGVQSAYQVVILSISNGSTDERISDYYPLFVE